MTYAIDERKRKIGNMSLGWQTESALVPRNAKPIIIDDNGKSMLSLKALIYTKENELKGSSSYKDNNETKISIARKKMTTTKNSQKLSSRTTTNVDHNNSTDDKVVESLKRKAELYDKLSTNPHESLTNPKDEYLVDFHKDNNDTSNIKQSSFSSSSHYQPPSYSQPSSHTHSSSSSTTTSSQHHYSTIEELSSLPHTSSSNASRVKSQWERGTHAKEYLDDIHIQTTLERHKAHTTTLPLHTTNDLTNTNVLPIHESTCSPNISASSNTHPTVKSAKEARRELLLSKKQKITATLS